MTEYRSLAEYVADHPDVADLGTLSFLAGVTHATVEQLAAGTAAPDPVHEAAILKVLPELPPELLRRHHRPEPEFTSTRRGQLPEGTQLVIVAAGELQLHDQVVYVPPRKQPGSHWIAVTATPESRGMFVAIGLGGVESLMKPDHPVRVARAA